MRQRLRLTVQGIVQGVGFRPFVYGLAVRHGLVGYVLNDATGVTIEVEGEAERVATFTRAVREEAPPLALVERIACEPLPPKDSDTTFVIEASQAGAEKHAFVSPDVCVCDDCRRELFDPTNRRYRYPFINCTNCGPRFTIIQAVPYDRAQTTMTVFPMCPACREEYDDPLDRRFHAQPNACPACGPQVRLVRASGDAPDMLGDAAIRAAQRLLAEGAILAVKGLGGYHLACDATNEEAVTRLRARKRREDRPFALMAAGLEVVESYCHVDAAERALLTSRQRPIVLLRRRAGVDAPPIAAAVAPGHRELGFMLPYTPLHLLLLAADEHAASTSPPSPLLRGEGGQTRRRLSRATPPLIVRGFVTSSKGQTRRRLSRATPPLIVRRFVTSSKGQTRRRLSLSTPPLIVREFVTSSKGQTRRRLSLSTPPSLVGKGDGGLGFHPPSVLVMTSGNVSDEPIAYQDDDALARLSGIADAFLVHDRAIYMRCDDSVVRCVSGGDDSQFLRRSRGYAPQPIPLAFAFPQPVLAVGAHLKNTFCLGKGRYALVSHHIGDLENLTTLTSFVDGVAHFKRLFDIEPAVIAHDLHPAYLSTQWAQGVAQETGARLVGVQHHHAHIASVLAERGLDGPVLGVAFDGTGFGADGRVWGGEFLVADRRAFERVAHLDYFPLPGGEVAVRQPWRVGAALLDAVYGDAMFELDLPFIRRLDRRQWAILRQMISRGVNSPLTSSIGRLFDAVAALLGVRDVVTYEGQAAVELEMLVEDPRQRANETGRDGYHFEIGSTRPHIVHYASALADIVTDIQRGRAPGIIAARFHNAVARLVVEVCSLLRDETGLSGVALSGGVFQNAFLLRRTLADLRAAEFQVYINTKVPANDGGIALGQAAVAAARLTV